MNKSPTVAYWSRKIEKEIKAHEKFRKQAKEAAEAARDDDEQEGYAFNVWWSSVKIQRQAIYANVPKPDVRRRFNKNPNPDEKNLAQLVERAIEYQVDSGSFAYESDAVVKSYVECGLGVPRVTYDVHTDLNEFELDEITSQSLGIEHIPYPYFHWEPGRTWDKVRWVAFESYTTRAEIKEQYDIDIKSGKEDDGLKRDSEEYQDEIQLFEIWYKPERTIYVICKFHDEPLEIRKDELNLSGFFPCPRPAFANLKTNELVPKPDFQFVKGQIDQINKLAHRIDRLTAQIKDLALADASISSDLASMHDEDDGAIKPVVDLVAKLAAAGGGDIKNAIWHSPILEKAQTVIALQEQLDQKKEQLYEVTGISDIVRGATKASETAAAQQLKGQWANVRLSEKTTEVARLWRETFRIFAEIICEHFEPQILTLQTGIEVTPGMMQIMQNDIGRSFAIDIETDSTIAQDDQEERQQTMELVKTLFDFVTAASPQVAQGALTPNFVKESLNLLASSHKHGKQLEDAIEEMTQYYMQLPGLTGQLQQLQGQLQQAGMQNQQLSQQLAQFNERKEAREDAKVQLQGQKQGLEGQDTMLDNRRDDAEAQANIQLKGAQTVKTMRDAREPYQQRAVA